MKDREKDKASVVVVGGRGTRDNSDILLPCLYSHVGLSPSFFRDGHPDFIINTGRTEPEFSVTTAGSMGAHVISAVKAAIFSLK